MRIITLSRKRESGRSSEPVEVYMLVIGRYDEYEVLAIYADRETAREDAREYNARYVCEDDGIECHARVEDITFHPAGSLPQSSLS